MEIRRTNPILRKQIRYLYKAYKTYGAPIWRAVAEKLNVRRREMVKVNLMKINKLTKENDQIVVPGKVLGFGFLDHPVIIAAVSFSESAKYKIEKINGKCLTYEELINLNPKGTNVKIII
jgi:large subunit ribosomal protein L18e